MTSIQKALTLTAVQEAAETLMLLHDQTTTLEVKNYLRQNNYLAFQQDVSQLMNDLVRQQTTWKANDNGQYRIYSFGQDSQEVYHEYLEKGSEFWEIEVLKTQQINTLGKIGTDGGSFSTTLKSNRYAIHQARLLVQQKMNSGYVQAVDQRLSKSLRTRYQNWLNQKVQQCTLAFYGVEKIEKQSANLALNQQVLQGQVVTTKSAGYEISFKTASSLTEMGQLLDQTSWDATQIKGVFLYLTGEKKTQETACLTDKLPLKAYSIQEFIGASELQQLLVHQNNLYQVRLIFDQQKTLTLSKFELDLQKELLPLLKKILSNG